MIVSALAVLVAVQSAGSLPRPSMAPDTATTLHEVSGLRVIHHFHPETGVVAVRLYLLGGARQCRPETAGIEPMLLRASALETWRPMARLGALTIAESTPDWTVGGFISLRAELDSAWAVFRARLAPLALTPNSIARARAELLAAARQRYSDPDSRLDMLARAVAFAGHPYALDPNGTEQSLTALQREDLLAYERDQFVTSRMLLVVVGNVSWAEVEPQIAATFAPLPRGNYQWTTPPPVPQRRNRWLAEHRPLATNYILSYFGGPTRDQEDYYAFEVATGLLGARLHRSTRLGSLSYAASAPLMPWALPVAAVYASSSDPAEVYRQILLEVWALTLEQSPHYVLSHFIDQWALDDLAPRMSSDAQADALGRAQLLFGDFREVSTHLDRLRQVTAASLRRVAQQYMRALQFAYLGDTTRMTGKW